MVAVGPAVPTPPPKVVVLTLKLRLPIAHAVPPAVVLVGAPRSEILAETMFVALAAPVKT